MDIDVSIIIVNYNTEMYLQECLKSIFQYSLGFMYEVIVVNNSNNTIDIDFITPDTKFTIIQNTSNLGFAKACNIGAEEAKGNFLFFLNPDTLIKDNVIEKLIKFYEHNQEMLKIGCLGCKLVNINYDEQHSYGNFPSVKSDINDKIFSLWNRVVYNDNKVIKNIKHQTIYKNIFKVDYITGAAFLIRKDIFEKVGGYDNRYFMYFEETDLQKRLFNNGLFSYLCIDLQIIHYKGVATSNSANYLRVLNFNSRLLYHQIHNSKLKYIYFCIVWHILDFTTFVQKLIHKIKHHKF